MPYSVTEFESTPNPNAVKVWVDRPVSNGPRSFLNAGAAQADPLAAALFSEAGATTVLLNGDWLTVNKSAEHDWTTVKARIRRVLQNAATRSDVQVP